MSSKTTDLRKSNRIDDKRKTPLKKKGANLDNSKKGRHILLWFLLFIMLIGIIAGAMLSPAFDLSEVIVRDGINVTKDEIYNIVDIKYEENIFRQNFGAIKNKVLELPYIKDASIKLLLPDKFCIEYEERKPYALIKYLESYIIVDKYGYLLEILKENERGLPVIYGIDMPDYELGKTLDNTSKTKYANVVLLLETARQKNFPYIIKEINYESISQVKVWVENSDVDIIYGTIDKNQVTEKLNYLCEILKKLDGKSGSLDISSNNYIEKMIFSERIK